jgi:hypothetical protein
MLLTKKENREPALILIGILYLLLFPALFRPVLHGADTVGYYSWLRSAVIEHTLDVRNAFHHYAREFTGKHPERDLNRKTPNGFTQNQWAAGSAILWAPLYLVAHTGVLIARDLGSGIPADGYSWPYTLAASLSSTIYGLLALYMIYGIARQLTGRRFPAGLAVIVLWLASPMVFYMYCHPLLSHANEAFIIALFLYVWWRTQNSGQAKTALLRGIVAGLATWIRPQNGVLILILGFETFVDILIALRQKRDLRPALSHGLVTLAGYLLLFIPLMIFWKIVFGSGIANTYAFSQGVQTLRWESPQFLKVLFSSDRGLFIWAPVTAPSLIGLWWLFKENARLACLLGGMFLAQLYVVSSWFGWSGNIAFGPRLWVAQTAIFSLGLAALINAFQKRRVLWILVGSFFIVWNLLLLAQYVLETVPRHGSVDLALMVRNQFMIIPEYLPRILRALLNRGQ